MTSGVQQTLLAMIPYWPYAGHQRCSGPIFSAWYDWGPTRPLESGGRCTSHGQSKIGEYSSNCYSWCKICMMLSDGKSPLPCTCTCTISIRLMERRNSSSKDTPEKATLGEIAWAAVNTQRWFSWVLTFHVLGAPILIKTGVD